MKIIFKYLKPFALILIVCVALLYGQAMCDLSLPNLMSDIVNVGIVQSGVDTGAPRRISADGMRLISLFVTEEGHTVIDGAYVLDQAKGEYSVKGDISPELSEVFGKAVYGFVQFGQANKAQSGGQSPGLSMDGDGVTDLTPLYQTLPILEALPKAALAPHIEKAADVDAMVYTQMAKGFIRLFYTELGIDMEQLRRDYIINTGIKMLGVALLGAAAVIIVGYLASLTATKVAKRMRHDVFERTLSFSGTEFNKFSTASLITRTTNDVQQVQMVIMIGIRMLCYAPIMGIGGIVFAVGKSPSMSWIIAVAVIALVGLIAVIMAIATPKFKLHQILVDKLNLVSRENLSGMLVIRAFGNEQYEEQRFEKANKDLFSTALFVNRVMATMMPIMMLIMNVVTLTIVWIGAKQISESTLQIGDMMAFMQYAMQILMSFLMLSMMFVMIPRAAVSIGRVGAVLNTEIELKDITKPKHIEKPRGLIEFKDVSFHYQNAEADVLEHISFTAEPGQTTAFIGSTGSGKSTLINLIPRFYDVTGGQILFDGVDVRELPQRELRDLVGYVPQKGILFSGNISSNVSYGLENATEEAIWQAIEVAQAREFVDSTEEKLYNPIAQGGDNVSGGQKQRLAIARALIKKPPVYIFDDSFSALDYNTDRALRSALKKFTSEATVLIVAQRVSTIMHAEKIVVLDEGRIVGIGTHRELLKSCKEYQEIAESQLSKEELA